MQSYHFDLEPNNTKQLANFFGPMNRHLQEIADFFEITINSRGNQLHIVGSHASLEGVAKGILRLYQSIPEDKPLTSEGLHLHLMDLGLTSDIPNTNTPTTIKTRKAVIKLRSQNQQSYIQKINTADVTFAIGPAGTGKTFLAVAHACEALGKGQVERIVLVRPAVEAGEKLGFLPGDMTQKVDPYLKPLFDALHFSLGVDYTEKLTARNQIEIAPLAYMRGRTLANAFIIFDESQNSTCEQMKMLLTRIGFHTKAVITGDLSQIDLANRGASGLLQAKYLLQGVKGVSFQTFEEKDVVRHPVVRRIIRAYDDHDSKTTGSTLNNTLASASSS